MHPTDFVQVLDIWGDFVETGELPADLGATSHATGEPPAPGGDAVRLSLAIERFLRSLEQRGPFG